MRKALLLAILLVSGCVVHVNKDKNAPVSEPAPPPPPPPPPPPRTGEKVNSESFMLKYVKKVAEVHQGVAKALSRLNIRVQDTDTPGDDNWNVRGFHSSGAFEINIHMNRHDHKTRTTVTVASARYSDLQCREWTRKIHAEIGKQIAENGSD